MVGVALLSLIAIPPARLELELIRIVASLPTVLGGWWQFLIGLIGLLAAVIAVATVVRRRWAVLRDMVLSVLVAIATGLILARLVHGSWEIGWGSSSVPDAGPWLPWIRLSAPTAAFAAASPHLTRSVRRLGWWLTGLATASAFLVGATMPTVAGASWLIGILGAAAIHLLFGSSRGRPDVDEVRQALSDLGLEVSALSPADRQSAGVFILEAVTAAGRPVDIKVYGRDASDTQVLTTVWRTVWFRKAGSPTSPGRLQQVEHEALLTLLAGQNGVLTQPVVTAGLAPNDDAVLVLERVGQAVATNAKWDAAVALRLWAMLSTLHAARIAHGQVDEDHVIDDGQRLGLVDFRGAAVTGGALPRRIDQAQALVTTVLAMGFDQALPIALEALGRAELTELLPFIQADPLTSDQRKALRDSSLDIDDLREKAAEFLEVEAPELERLRRVTWGSLLRAALPLLAFFALASVLAGMDLNDLGATLADASWWFVGVGLLLAQVPRFFQAVSALGASPIPVPLGRLYGLQLAQSYIALTIPGGAARIAMNIRFFQRHGLTPGSALAVGAMDSFGGFLGQLILLGLILVFSEASLDLDLDSTTTSGLVRLLAALGIAIVVALTVVLVIPRLRQTVVGRVRTLWVEAVGAIRGVASPRRLGMLFGGNLTTEILFAVALGAFAVSMGYPIGLPELIFINVTVSLLAGIMPIPGGIGVVEGGLIFGLARAGMPEDAAFAAAIMFRFATYYLPPIWGIFAFRWLERSKHL
jgi:uncharacterized membrane protein YbhN (UPF0104 family)